LCASRAAVLASLLPADFPRETFERLLGFGRPAKEIVEVRQWMDTGFRVPGGFGYDRAFKAPLRGKDLANEYNPVACSVLEATVDYPFRFGEELARKARKWAKVWLERIEKRLAPFYPEHKFVSVHAYIFARTVPDPEYQEKADDETGRWYTPLVPDWHVLKTANHGECGSSCLLAVPAADKTKGTWRVEAFRRGGRGANQVARPPQATYSKGKGVSLFTGRQVPADYIKAMAQQGRMKNALYAVALKTPQGLKFQSPERADLDALKTAEKELARLRPAWQKANVLPTEKVPKGDKTGDGTGKGTDKPLERGELYWADMFMPRQLLAAGTLVEELRSMRAEVSKAEGRDMAEAVIHLLALALDKFLNHNCNATRWESSRAVIKSKMDRHDYAYKLTFAEMAPCNPGTGFEWAVDNVAEAYQGVSLLSHNEQATGATVSLGSSASLPEIGDKSVTAVVVDPPYADNVQYSELADFFYVWLKRTQGHRRPEWFSTNLCDHDQEAVVNASRFKDGKKKTKDAKAEAHVFYQRLMTETFRECRRILRDDGCLTVMFTHKKQEAWEALFTSLIQAGFTITATWPVKTESEHSLHQARKNAAQSTVILVARKRAAKAGVGYFDQRMREEIRQAARRSAERLKGEGLNPVDQLVGSFGPAMEVYSRHDEVRTDTGDPVGVEKAIDEASDAVSRWRIEQLAARGLEGVEAEGQFYLLCWDVLGAAEFRYNEAHLLGKAVGMDVDQLVAAGLVTKSGEKIKILPARGRRRERALEPDEIEELLFGTVTVPKKRAKKDVRKVHPNDPQFRTALDGCHALALRYIEAKGGSAGIGPAKGLMRQQNWSPESAVAKLMEALVRAAPEAVRFEKGKKSVAAMFPEFRAWHALLEPLFGVQPPEWKEKAPPKDLLTDLPEPEQEGLGEDLDEEEEGQGDEE
jgi:adenine-specific DNA methylase